MNSSQAITSFGAAGEVHLGRSHVFYKNIRNMSASGVRYHDSDLLSDARFTELKLPHPAFQGQA